MAEGWEMTIFPLAPSRPFDRTAQDMLGESKSYYSVSGACGELVEPRLRGAIFELFPLKETG
jgi:hypothetical protein